MTLLHVGVREFSAFQQKIILYRLKEIEYDHIILFGDFNVRPDTKALLEVSKTLANSK